MKTWVSPRRHSPPKTFATAQNVQAYRGRESLYLPGGNLWWAARPSPTLGSHWRVRRSQKTGVMWVFSLCSSSPRSLPLIRNFARAGRLSTLGVVTTAAPRGFSSERTLRKNPTGLSRCSMTSTAVIRSNPPSGGRRDLAKPGSFRSSLTKGTAALNPPASISTASTSRPKSRRRTASAPLPAPRSSARLRPVAYSGSIWEIRKSWSPPIVRSSRWEFVIVLSMDAPLSEAGAPRRPAATGTR